MSKVSWDIAAQSHEILRVFVWWSLTVYTWLHFFTSDVHIILIRHLHISHSASYLPLPPPPKFYITFVFHFSWVLQLSQEKNNAYAIFWRANKVHYGRCASGEFNILYKLV